MPNQNDTTTYSVELSAAPESREDRIAAAKKLAKEIDSDPKKVFQVISKAPKTIARSMSREDAEAMAQLCRDAGLEVSLVATEPKIERWAPAAKIAGRQGSAGTSSVASSASAKESSSAAEWPSDTPNGTAPNGTASPARPSQRTTSPSTPSPTSSRTTGSQSSEKVSVSFGGMSASSPYVTILLKPRQTMRYVLDTAANNSAFTIMVVLAVAVFLPLLIVAPFAPAGSQLLSGVGILLVIAVVPSIMTSIIVLYINGLLYSIVGKQFFQGQASQRDARLAYAWGLIPGVWMTVAILIMSLLVALAGIANAEALVILLIVAMGILGLVGGVWSIIVQSQTLGAAHGISGWQGFATIIVSGLIPSAVLFVLQLLLTPASI